MFQRWLVATAVVCGFAATAFAADEWVGARVMPRAEFQLKERERVIPDSKLNSMPYVVRKQNGEWLLVGDRVPGWAHRSQVAPLAEAAAYYTQLLAKKKDDPLTLVRRAIVYTETQQPDLAQADYSAALKLDPKNATALNNRGALLAAKKDYEKAVADFSAAIKLTPNFAQAYNNRGSVYVEQKKLDEALADFDAAIKHDAEDARALYNRANLWEAKGDLPKAIADYQAAIKLRPNHSRAYNNLAWIYATHPTDIRNGAEAVKLAEKAATLTQEKDVETLDTLAAAYAEAGEWDKALATQGKVINLLPADKRKEAEDRLLLYRDKKAFRSGM